MPTENERKFVLRADCEPEIKKIAAGRSEICQGYLIATRGITVRVRSVTSKKDSRYFFTLKCNTGGRVVEIEESLDQRDFLDLWDISLNKLEKVRYKVNHGSEGWVVDFFKDHQDRTYFVMAECEMPEGQMAPHWIPPEISASLVYEVPLTDTRFSSKLLGDARFALRLLEKINRGEI